MAHAPPRRWRYPRRTALGVAGLLVFLFGVLPVGMSYVKVHVARDVVPAPHLGAPHENVTLTTSDGLKLKGWYVPSRNGAAVIAFPGRKGPQPHTRMLVRHGYGVLLLDRRGEGESEGEPTSWGWGGARDLKAAVAYLQQPPGRRARPHRRARTVGRRRADDRGRRLHARAEGGRVRGRRHALLSRAARHARAEKWIVAPFMAVETAAIATFYNQTPPPSLNGLVAKVAPRPLLLMYSGSGQGGEIELNPVYHRAAGAPRRCGRSRAPATSAASGPSPPSTSAASSASSTPRCARARAGPSGSRRAPCRRASA